MLHEHVLETSANDITERCRWSCQIELVEHSIKITAWQVNKLRTSLIHSQSKANWKCSHDITKKTRSCRILVKQSSKPTKLHDIVFWVDLFGNQIVCKHISTTGYVRPQPCGISNIRIIRLKHIKKTEIKIQKKKQTSSYKYINIWYTKRKKNILMSMIFNLYTCNRMHRSLLEDLMPRSHWNPIATSLGCWGNQSTEFI